MPHPLAAVDPLAERRFAYGRAAAAEGDFRTAAEVFEQALDRAPGWAAAWFALGEAREKLGDVDGAAEAFRATLRCDPADAQGAIARLALLERGDPPPALPSAYVARLFDQYAPRFEAHLTEALRYRAPAQIAQTLAAAAPGRRFGRAFDFGCGAGLVGQALRQRIGHLTGVDLAPAMIERARKRGVYDALIVGEATAALMRQPLAAFDLIVAADSLVYVGDLATIFSAIAATLTRTACSRSRLNLAAATDSRSSRRCGSPMRAPTSRRLQTERGSVRCSSDPLPAAVKRAQMFLA